MKQLIKTLSSDLSTIVAISKFFESSPELQSLGVEGEIFEDDSTLLCGIQNIIINDKKYEVEDLECLKDGVEAPEWTTDQEIGDWLNELVGVMYMIAGNDPQDIEHVITREDVSKYQNLISQIEQLNNAISLI